MEMDSSSGSDDEDYILETNPLLIDVILERLMDVLSLEDVKNCRMVCHKWNYFAEPVLKKRGKIVFTDSFRPSHFMAHFSQPHHLAQPFTAFSLVAGRNPLHLRLIRAKQYNSYNKHWTLSEINKFFTKWGKYIKKLELTLFEVWLHRDYRNRACIRALNIDNLFESMGSLEDLVLVGRVGPLAGVEVSLKTLSSVKNICLNTCYIKLDSFEKRLTPSKFKSVDVIFRRNGETQPNTVINDLVDFSRCSDIDIRMERRGVWSETVASTIKFDFSRDFVNSNKIQFRKIVPLNVKKSKTKTHRFSICSCPTEQVQINLKELELKNCKIDLTLLSATIEKLTMIRCDVVSLDIQPLDLPNLKFLSLNHLCNGTIISDSTIFKIVSLFVNCENLFDLELTRDIFSDDNVESELDVSFLPKSVKVLKFGDNHGLKFVGSVDPMEVDVLILNDHDETDSENSLSTKKVLDRIKTKVLIRAVFCCESYFREEPLKETVSQFLADIVQDEKLEKTIAELKHGPHILKGLEPIDRSNSCKNSMDKSSPVFHEFLGKFLLTYEQVESEYF